MTISEIMDLLPQSDRDRLMLLFESGKPGYAVYDGNKVIGVNDPPELVMEVQLRGLWYLGTIKEGSA